jgi:hypothetical protein
VAREDRLEVGMHIRCLNSMNGVDLGDNYRMTFFQELFHAMVTDDLRGDCCDALELIFLSRTLELHG